ncbi:hypothetical protein evm_004338 [Chilo suppressalis]|nr:hypothetical protein evm_004338 [Chilo suppressalis]
MSLLLGHRPSIWMEKGDWPMTHHASPVRIVISMQLGVVLHNQCQQLSWRCAVRSASCLEHRSNLRKFGASSIRPYAALSGSTERMSDAEICSVLRSESCESQKLTQARAQKTAN